MPYRLEETKKHNIVLLFLAGIVAGWTNENTGGALILMLLLILGKHLFEKKKLQSCEISGLLGSMIGFLLLVLAPGNKVRAQDFISTNGKMYDFIHDFYGFLDVLEKGQIVLFVLLVVSIALAITLHKKKEEIVYSIFYALCGIAAVFAIILSPVPVLFDRSMFGATTFLIIGTCIPLYLVMEEKSIKLYSNSLLACLVLFSSFNYLRTLPDLAYIRYQYAKREAYVKTQKAAGNVNPVIFQFNNEFETSYNPYYGLGDVSPYRLLWVNKFYAEVHGIESVQTTTLDKWTTIYANGDPTLINITDFDAYVETVNQDKYTVLITTSYLNKTLYADYMKGLQTLGFKELNTYMTGVYQNHLLSSSVSNEEGQYLETSVNGHDVYMCSNFDETLSDVLVDNIEYTNDRPGITFVVFDNEKDKVVDSLDTVAIAGLETKDKISKKVEDAKSDVEAAKENCRIAADKSKGKINSGLLKMQMNIEETKKAIEAKKELHDKEKLQKYIDEQFDYAADALELAFLLAKESKLAFLEALEAQVEFDEKYGE